MRLVTSARRWHEPVAMSSSCLAPGMRATRVCIAEQAKRRRWVMPTPHCSAVQGKKKRWVISSSCGK